VRRGSTRSADIKTFKGSKGEEKLRKNNVIICTGSSGGSNRNRRIGWRKKIWTVEEFTSRRSSRGAHRRKRPTAVRSHEEIPSAVGSGESTRSLVVEGERTRGTNLGRQIWVDTRQSSDLHEVAWRLSLWEQQGISHREIGILEVIGTWPSIAAKPRQGSGPSVGGGTCGEHQCHRCLGTSGK
jgi:hypothetical protein